MIKARECIAGLLMIGETPSNILENKLIPQDRKYLHDLKKKGINYRLETNPKNANWIDLYVSYEDSQRLLQESKIGKK